MIDTITLPSSRYPNFPQKLGGVITCVYCGFSGGSIYDRPDQPSSVMIKASFRYVNDIGDPTEGVCGRYECRERLAKEANKQFNAEVDRRFKIQYGPLPDLKVDWEDRITFTPEKEKENDNGNSI